MLEGLTPDLAPRLVLAVGGVGIALVLLVLVLIFLRRRNSPLFIKGGKSREPRLMVLDAAAVDPKRRLVLIRRDDVEHLIMIGGPTDIVIESGIADRSRPAVARLPAEEPAPPRAAPPTLAVEPKPLAPAPERRPEAARTVTAPAAEATRVAAAERRPEPAPAPTARNPAPVAAPIERQPASVNRVVEEPRIDRNVRGVSPVGAMLYGEDRDPMTPGGSQMPRPAAARQEPEPGPARPANDAARPQPVVAAANTAEAVLDAARSRVLSAGPADPAPRVSPDADATRRSPVQPTAAASTPVAVQAAQPADVTRVRDADPSDFEKLLEAELDASGVFSQQSPQVRGETRVTSAAPADPSLVQARRPPPITGATPDVTSESEVARLLGEIAVNRKT